MIPSETIKKDISDAIHDSNMYGREDILIKREDILIKRAIAWALFAIIQRLDVLIEKENENA